ncbi:MAG: amidophosphoribosyltransferase [Clostridiales Family XIII bacterium]|jgi:amidophosphoribosyltransferase|nr:amidophosphoribosyltransferase [Clostridiales Family XIII bacterium]
MCGIFGIAGPPGVAIPAALDTFYALFALQHRGQEACGIAVNDKGVITCRKDIGLVLDVFDQETIDALPGNMAVGHVRYSTTGDSNIENAQPVAVSHIKGNLAISHNGNLVNASELKREIEMEGGIFRGTSDSEIIAYTIVRERLGSSSIEEAVKKAMRRIKGAYCILAMSPRKLIAARDPNGFRPLVLGKLRESYILASESCAIDAVGGEFMRDVEPGEIILIEGGKLTSIDSGLRAEQSFCSFEFIYFSRPDSVHQHASVELARRRMGRALARESGVDADIVVAVPDSGVPAAAGYAEESGLQNVVGLIKNRYIGRTFIQPHQNQREQAVRLKLNPLAANIAGKRVVLIDDSIVRGTTSARIVGALREAGATEVHMRVSAPPFRYPCYFGTDVPDKDRLIAVGRAEKDIARMLGADSLAYLNVGTLKRILNDADISSCAACFSGEYPIAPPVRSETDIFSQPIITLTGK